TENGDGDQVADEKERFDEGEGQGREEDRQEDIQHAALGILRANLHHLFAVGNRRLLDSLQPNVALDELDRAIGSRSYGLGGSAGKPVNDGASGDQAENKRRIQQRQLIHVHRQAVGQRHNDGEDHGGGAHHGGSNQHGFRRRLKRVAGSVVGF